MIYRILLGILLGLSVQTACAEDPSPAAAKQVVEKLNAVLIDVMKNAKELGYQGRYKKLDPVIRETHEFEAIAQIALGNHWKDLSLEQKKKFVDKLTDLSVSTYAAQFNDYSGEDFKYDSVQNPKPSRTELSYNLTAPKEKPVKFQYVLNAFNGQWAIINIVVDGISDLALKKAQYGSVIEREGFDSLMNKLSQKITDYAKNNTSSS